MNLPRCTLDNTMLEHDVRLAYKQGILEDFTLVETCEGFYLSFIVTCSSVNPWYLATRSNRTQPRLFKNFDRFLNQLADFCPSEKFILQRQKLSI